MVQNFRKLCMQCWYLFLHCLKMHIVKGSPVYPSRHVHIGVWLTTWHSALLPQDPMQGSWHILFMHAWWVEHSALFMHSGLQFGGLLTKPGKHAHDCCPLIDWYKALGPQTHDGQGGSTSRSYADKFSKKKCYLELILSCFIIEANNQIQILHHFAFNFIWSYSLKAVLTRNAFIL